MSGSKPVKPRRRSREDKSDQPVTFLPQGNKQARRAYLSAVLGLIPGLGLVFGFPALFFGALGYRDGKRDAARRGLGHAFVSMILGVLEILVNSIGLTLIGIHFGWW